MANEASNTHGRGLAIAAGTLATGGALANLLWEPYRSGTIGIDHALVPVVVAITIAAGHLASQAGWRKPLAAVGFAFAFMLGTYITIGNSVGRQAEKADTLVVNATAQNTARAEVESQLRVGRGMLADELRAVAKECASGAGSRCTGHRASVSVYQAAVAGWETKLASIPVRVVSAKAERMADVAALFGFDKSKAKAAVQLVDPFALALLLELVAIVAFGYGCHRSMPATVATFRTHAKDQTPTDKGEQSSQHSVSVLLRQLKMAATVPHTKEQAEADIRLLIASGGTVPRQDDLVERWRVSKSCVSRWLGNFEERGLLSRQTSGRLKIVSAA